MSEISKYEAQVKRMQGLCEEHDLTYRFIKDKYPMAFVIRPAQGAGEQLSMLENIEDEGYTSPEAYMKWAFQNDELRQVVDGGTFTIEVALRKKIETILLKMIRFWLQYFFRDIIEKDSLRRGMMPVIDESEADDADEPDAEDFEDGADEDADESLIEDAARLVRMENKASVALLQRRLKVGYASLIRS